MIDPLGGPAYWWPFVLGFLISYLIGAIPFGLILAKLAGAGDVRRIGPRSSTRSRSRWQGCSCM